MSAPATTPGPDRTTRPQSAADPTRLTKRQRLAECRPAVGGRHRFPAVVTTVYFSQRAQHGAGHAMTVSVAVVGAIAILCLGLVWLLPKSAPQEHH